MKLFLFIGLFTFISTCFPQSSKEKHLINKTIDSSYIEDFSDKLVVRQFIKQKFNKINIEDNKENKSITLKPNQRVSLGGGINYKWLGIDLAFKIPQNKDSESRFGKTSAFDIQANVYLRQFTIDLLYLNYKGYYIDNSSEYDKSSGEKILYEGLTSGIIGIDFNYLFNHTKFSYRAAYLQNERQKKSAGSFVLGIFINSNSIKSDSSIIPQNFWNEFNEEALITNARFLQLGSQFGYAHTFVIKKLYLTLAFSLGLGYQKSNLRSIYNNESSIYHSLSIKARSRLAIGYNGDRLNFGFQNITDDFLLGNSEKTTIDYTVGSFRFFVAYRFKAPQFLEKIGNSKLFPKH